MTHTSTTSDPETEGPPSGDEESASPAGTDSLPWSDEKLDQNIWEILFNEED